MSIVDKLFPRIQEYGAVDSPTVTIERAPDSTDLPEISCFDFIEYDTKTVPYSRLTSEEQTDVAADERTIVLHFPSGYVCVDVEQLVGFAKNPNSKFYECRGVNHKSDHQLDDEVGKSFIRLGLGPGGSYFSVFTKNLVEFLKSGDRIVSVVSIPDSTIVRTMSEDAAKQINPESYVSSNHCQAGSSLSLSYLAKTVIEGVPTLGKWKGVTVPLVTMHDEEESGEEESGEEESDEEESDEITTLVGVDFSSGPAEVTFAPWFNESIVGVEWGNVKSVTFGAEFNQPIVDVNWGNVDYVTFGYDFNKPIIGVDWGNVKFVTFGEDFNKPIVGVDWGNVKSVTFGYEFDHPIVGVDWGNVQSVHFGRYFDHPVVGVNWRNVVRVIFGKGFSKPIFGVNWGNVKTVAFGGYNANSLSRADIEAAYYLSRNS